MLDGAAVRVSMVGFDDGSEKHRVLDGTPVTEINADLSTGLDLTQARTAQGKQRNLLSGAGEGRVIRYPSIPPSRC